MKSSPQTRHDRVMCAYTTGMCFDGRRERKSYIIIWLRCVRVEKKEKEKLPQPYRFNMYTMSAGVSNETRRYYDFQKLFHRCIYLDTRCIIILEYVIHVFPTRSRSISLLLKVDWTSLLCFIRCILIEFFVWTKVKV